MDSFCTNCGAQIPDPTMTFCPTCGTKLNVPSTSNSTDPYSSQVPFPKQNNPYDNQPPNQSYPYGNQPPNQNYPYGNQPPGYINPYGNYGVDQNERINIKKKIIIILIGYIAFIAYLEFRITRPKAG